MELKKLNLKSKKEPIEIKIKDFTISRDNFTVIAGPCTIENYDELLEIAQYLKTIGINFFRGGAYKMRTSPYDFQGLGKKGLEYIKEVADKTGMVSVSEIVSVEDIDVMKDYVDILQVGTRNMHNYRLLSKLGKINNPIILKRGMSSTIKEWIFAAEYILNSGNKNVILSERGIRTFETYTRNTLDISSVPAIKEETNFPIIVDPSHSSGRRNMIKPLSWAAMAAGADGLLIETHFEPDKTVCDSIQTIDYSILEEIIKPMNKIISLWGKTNG